MLTYPKTRTARLACHAVAGVLLLTACGADDQVADVPAEAPAAASYNDADVAFLEGMIPHHRQAVEMAEMVPDRTDRPELVDLADDIIASQNEEIETMSGMLADAGVEPPPADGTGGHDAHDMEMSGMMSAEQMEELTDLSGEAFDLRFTDMMIRHHQGAVEASEQVLEEGEHPEIAELAEQVIDEQQAEIRRMQDWQRQWRS